MNLESYVDPSVGDADHRIWTHWSLRMGGQRTLTWEQQCALFLFLSFSCVFLSLTSLNHLHSCEVVDASLSTHHHSSHWLHLHVDQKTLLLHVNHSRYTKGYLHVSERLQNENKSISIRIWVNYIFRARFLQNKCSMQPSVRVCLSWPYKNGYIFWRTPGASWGVCPPLWDEPAWIISSLICGNLIKER